MLSVYKGLTSPNQWVNIYKARFCRNQVTSLIYHFAPTADIIDAERAASAYSPFFVGAVIFGK